MGKPRFGEFGRTCYYRPTLPTTAIQSARTAQPEPCPPGAGHSFTSTDEEIRIVSHTHKSKALSELVGQAIAWRLHDTAMVSHSVAVFSVVGNYSCADARAGPQKIARLG